MRTSARRRSSATARLLAATAIGASLVTTAGCGSASPLEQSLTEPQLQQLDVALTSRISATDGAALEVTERNNRVKALYAACKPLDATNALLHAVADVCRPAQITEKLGAVLPERCAKPAAICVRALDRIAVATDDLGKATKALDEQVRQATDDLACRTELQTTDVQHTAYANLSAAYRVLALGITQDDKEIATLGQNRISDALAQLKPAGTVEQRTKKMRSACKLG